MSESRLPLEDTFGDILRKAMRGTGTSGAALAAATGIPESRIAAWLKDDGTAGDAETQALSRALHLDAATLAESAEERWYPAPVERHDVRRHAQHPHPSNGYVFFTEGGREAALVDPAGAPHALLHVLREGGYGLRYILITHKHADHCDAAGAVAREYPEAQIVMHGLDVGAIGPLAGDARPVRDGETLPFAGGDVLMLHTPGHTDGSSCFLYRSRSDPAGVLFTGDTLFAGSVGGAFGDASTYADILRSVDEKIFSLEGRTLLMPGHGPPTTLALAREHNPFFQRG